MVNHDEVPTCTWRVARQPSRGGALALELRAPLRRWPKAGQELTIRYAYEGNSGLLFRYGFVEADNEHDHAVLACPLGPSAAWDDATRSKALLLQARSPSSSV